MSKYKNKSQKTNSLIFNTQTIITILVLITCWVLFSLGCQSNNSNNSNISSRPYWKIEIVSQEGEVLQSRIVQYPSRPSVQNEWGGGTYVHANGRMAAPRGFFIRVERKIKG